MTTQAGPETSAGRAGRELPKPAAQVQWWSSSDTPALAAMAGPHNVASTADGFRVLVCLGARWGELQPGWWAHMDESRRITISSQESFAVLFEQEPAS